MICFSIFFFFLTNASIFILAVAVHVSSFSCLLLLALKARSPLENSVPCLANRTLDDDPRVRRTPSVGWLSKSMGWGRGKDGKREGRMTGLPSGVKNILESVFKGNMEGSLNMT